MSEKMPIVSGKVLIRFLESLGYEVVRQRGSHVRLVKHTVAGNHKISIPNHNPVAKGTLSDILSKVRKDKLPKTPKMPVEKHFIEIMEDFPWSMYWKLTIGKVGVL
jgi:predicted RNA binding protein YcfA (HicA-like mRNA interferase family)